MLAPPTWVLLWISPCMALELIGRETVLARLGRHLDAD